MSMKKASGGDFSLPRRVRTCSGLRNFSWNISRLPRVFPNRRINRRRGGVWGAKVSPDATLARAQAWPHRGGVWPPGWPHSGHFLAQSSLRDYKVLATCPVQFREYFLYSFSEIQKQQKTGTGTVASC